MEISEIVDPDLARIRRVTLAPGDKVPAGRLALGNPIEIVARRMVTGMKVGAVIGFCGGFLLAYQNSSSEFSTFLPVPVIDIISRIERFWGWTENKREEELDFAELSQRAREGLPLYGESHQSLWVQGAAHRNSAYSQLKFCTS